MWKDNFSTYIYIFNVGRGCSIFIRTPNNYGIIYDLGSSEEFSPLSFVREHFIPNLTKYKDGNGKIHDIAQLVISHPHYDHISDIDNLKNISVNLVTCPHDKSADEFFDFSTIEKSDKIIKYRELFKERKLPLQTIQHTTRHTTPHPAEYGIYYVKPPKVKELHPSNDSKYVNGCSIILYFRYANNSILIPGDITPESLTHILDEGRETEKRYSIFSYSSKFNEWHLENSDQPSLRSLLANYGLSVLVAPHHGLESCFPEYLFSTIREKKPGINIISDKRHEGEHEGTIDERYRSPKYSKGINGRFLFSTRHDSHIVIKFAQNGRYSIYSVHKPEGLLNI